MKSYVIKRLIYMLITLIGASMLIFMLYALTPGDFVDSNPKLSMERKIELKELYGLDKPVVERYLFGWAICSRAIWASRCSTSSR